MPKKNRPKTTVNVDAVKRDTQKLGQKIFKENPSLFGGEISSGSVRRESPLEQDMGSSKYKEMIHDHNKKNEHILDRLPFTFPKKRMVRSHLEGQIPVECVECGHISFGSEHTYMMTCPECKKATKVINPEAEKRGEDLDFVPGFLATANDILKMREERAKKNSQ